MDNDIYQEHIMDHYKNPRRKFTQEHPTFSQKENNPLCGDEIQIYLTIKKSKITNISFVGHGCAISQASASILMEHLQNQSLSKITKISEQEMIDLLHIPISFTRSKCALLALHTLKAIRIPTKNHPLKSNQKQSQTKKVFV